MRHYHRPPPRCVAAAEKRMARRAANPRLNFRTWNWPPPPYVQHPSQVYYEELIHMWWRIQDRMGSRFQAGGPYFDPGDPWSLSP